MSFLERHLGIVIALIILAMSVFTFFAVQEERQMKAEFFAACGETHPAEECISQWNAATASSHSKSDDGFMFFVPIDSSGSMAPIYMP